MIFSKKLSDPDGTISSSSINNGIEYFFKHHKEPNIDEEDFNFTADSLMKVREDESMEECGSKGEGSVSGQRCPNGEEDCALGTTSLEEDNEGPDDDSNLNDVSVLSDDGGDSRPTSPSRVFRMPSPNLSAGRTRPRNQPAQRKQSEDAADGSLSADEGEYSDDGMYHEDEDESDNSSIDTAGMKHSQVVDEDNFFFCPEPQPQAQLMLNESPGDEEGKKMLAGSSGFQGQESSPFISEDINRDRLCSEERELLHREPNESGEDLEVSPEARKSVESTVVGISVTALPREMSIVPHPIEAALFDVVERGFPGEHSAGEERDSESCSEPEPEPENDCLETDEGDCVVDEERDGGGGSPGESDAPELPLSTSTTVSCDDVERNFEMVPTRRSVSPSLPGSDLIDNISEMTSTVASDNVHIAGLWERHPVRFETLAEKEKVKVRAFGRTSYEDECYQPRVLPDKESLKLSSSLSRKKKGVSGRYKQGNKGSASRSFETNHDKGGLAVERMYTSRIRQVPAPAPATHQRKSEVQSIRQMSSAGEGNCGSEVEKSEQRRDDQDPTSYHRDGEGLLLQDHTVHSDCKGGHNHLSRRNSRYRMSQPPPSSHAARKQQRVEQHVQHLERRVEV